MIGSFHIDDSDLVKFVKGLQAAKTMTTPVLVDTMNEFTDGLAREIRQNLANFTGLPTESIRRYVQTKHATVEDPTYDLLVNEGAITDEIERRGRLPQRDWQGREELVGEEQLVMVLNNYGYPRDDRVCEECIRIAEEGPYTMAEALALRPHGDKIGEHHCRCIIVPWVSARRIPVTFEATEGEGGVSIVKQRATITLAGLAERLAHQIELNIFAKVVAKTLYT